MCSTFEPSVHVRFSIPAVPIRVSLTRPLRIKDFGLRRIIAATHHHSAPGAAMPEAPVPFILSTFSSRTSPEDRDL
ncbi:unnamed protein product [Fusarium venenatum]|uniref:Uncharacterized protein n=1 Tax=Fusarium venenatum TaxID=56646 RepID=A0A2L2T230_9HYPO|nr:uncharacterized protein FVRRES_12834 [Fusarium venenatum]CEI40143.1 unnamed protein product [Fusarium venenatum]